MRVICTGSRDWDRPDVVWSCLDILAAEAEAIGEEVTVVHGACPRGADAQADHWARLRSRDGKPTRVEWHPADWARLGRKAGFARNAHMVSLGADVVLAFLRDDSPGTSQCIELAERAGLTVQVVRYEDLPAAVSEPARSEGASQ